MLTNNNIPSIYPLCETEFERGCIEGRKTFTREEEIVRTTVQMRETIDRLLKFEKRLHEAMDDFTRHLTGDNVAFKNLINTAYTTFSSEIKNEINNFEKDMENSISLFVGQTTADYSSLKDTCENDIKLNYETFNKKLTDFETGVNDEQTSFEKSINELIQSFKDATNSKIENNDNTMSQAFEDYQTKQQTEINTFEATINNKYKNFTDSVNTSITTFEDTWTKTVTDRIDTQDSKLSDAELYMKTNLVATVTSLIGDMKDAGEFDDIIEGEVFNDFESKLNEKDERVIASNKNNGVYDLGVAGSFVANTTSDGKPDVCGFVNGLAMSKYTMRDSVALYSRNDSVKPIKFEGETVFNGDEITIPSSYDIAEIKAGSYVDVIDGEGIYSSIVDSVDHLSNKITVKWGGLYKQNSNSDTPIAPTNGSTVYINRITKIWALNSNVVIKNDPDSFVNNATGFELGVNNNKEGAQAVGIDIVNTGAKDTAVALNIASVSNGKVNNAVRIRNPYVGVTITSEGNTYRAYRYTNANGKEFYVDGDGNIYSQLDTFKVETDKSGLAFGNAKIEPTKTNVDLGSSTNKFKDVYVGNNLVIGNYHLWVSSDGKLRVKNGVPSNDTDGAIVGTQE